MEENNITCKTCKYCHWKQEPEHGKTVYYCNKVNQIVNRWDSCMFAKLKGEIIIGSK